jgi:hypothetical protein
MILYGTIALYCSQYCPYLAAQRSSSLQRARWEHKAVGECRPASAQLVVCIFYTSCVLPVLLWTQTLSPVSRSNQVLTHTPYPHPHTLPTHPHPTHTHTPVGPVEEEPREEDDVEERHDAGEAPRHAPCKGGEYLWEVVEVEGNAPPTCGE